jgi:hypothetical protein
MAAVSTATMPSGCTYEWTEATAPVQQLARRRLWFGFELRPPVAKRLERNPLSLAILALVQLTAPPHLMVRAPECLAVASARQDLLVGMARCFAQISTTGADRRRAEERGSFSSDIAAPSAGSC